MLIENDEEDKKFIDDFITSRKLPANNGESDQNTFQVTSWTMAYDISEAYRDLYRYLWLCREKEKIDCYRKRYGVSKSATKNPDENFNLYPPGLVCISGTKI